MRLREQARSVYGKLSIMADVEVNAPDGKSLSIGKEDENALLADDGEGKQDYDTTGVGNIDTGLMCRAIQGLEKKIDLLAGTPS